MRAFFALFLSCFVTLKSSHYDGLETANWAFLPRLNRDVEELPGRLAFRRFHPRDVISGEVHKGAQRYRETRQWSSGGCGGGGDDLFRNLALSTLSIRSLPSFSLTPVALFQESLHKGARREDLSPFPLSFSLHPRSGRGGCSGRHPREHSRTAITIATACLIGEGSP